MTRFTEVNWSTQETSFNYLMYNDNLLDLHLSFVDTLWPNEQDRQEFTCKFRISLLLVTDKSFFLATTGEGFKLSALPDTYTKSFCPVTHFTQQLSFMLFWTLSRFLLVGWGLATSFLSLLSVPDLLPSSYTGLPVRLVRRLASRRSIHMKMMGFLCEEPKTSFFISWNFFLCFNQKQWECPI